MNNKTNTINIRISSVASICVLISILMAVVPMSLNSLHSRMQTALCANNLRGCVQAWGQYASEFDGKHMAWWDDSTNPGHPFTQLPYTMWYYTKGISLPGAAHTSSGWYNPETQEYGGGFSPLNSDVKDNPQYHCPKFISMPKTVEMETPFASGLSSYSYCMPMQPIQNDGVSWGLVHKNFYPEPDRFTHPATTPVIQDIAGLIDYKYLNLWTTFSQRTLGLHNGKDNYGFADGHVELLDSSQLNEDMFKLMYLLED